MSTYDIESMLNDTGGQSGVHTSVPKLQGAADIPTYGHEPMLNGTGRSSCQTYSDPRNHPASSSTYTVYDTVIFNSDRHGLTKLESDSTGLSFDVNMFSMLTGKSAPAKAQIDYICTSCGDHTLPPDFRFTVWEHQRYGFR